MPSPTIGKRTRWAPSPRAQIDWSHPLAASLASCVLLNHYPNVRDMVTGRAPDTATPTAAALEPSVYGQGYQFQNNVSTSRFEWSTSASPTVTLPMSILVIGNTPFQNNMMIAQGGASTGKGWCFGTTAPGGNLVFQLGGVAAYQSTGGVPATFLMPFMGGVSVDGNGGTARFYVDGRGVGSATVGTMQTPASTGLIIGGNHNGTAYGNPFFRGLTATFVWSRALTAGDFAALAADPFCMFRW